MNVLEINNVTKRFGNLVAVRDVSLNVAKGELCAIIGPNGAGKTTFFNLISGYFPPTSGTIMFDGNDITRLATHERVVRGMARTFQITEIFPELTVFENVRIATEVSSGYRLRPWISRSEVERVHRHVEETLKLVSLEAKSDRLVGELSHGDQRAAEIAMALALKPHLLLLDEPTAGLASADRGALMRVVRTRVDADGVAVLFTEHDMDVVFAFADRVVVLDRGHVIAQGTPDAVRANAEVRRAYLGDNVIPANSAVIPANAGIQPLRIGISRSGHDAA
jgi:branched-chain amino acid transport system ATP-binding protein